MHNFGMGRLLTADELARNSEHNPKELTDAPLYLELFHDPGLTYPYPKLRGNESGNIFRILTPFSSVIPVDQEHLNRLMENMYTSRFVVAGGRAMAYHVGVTAMRQDSIPMPGIEDGMYEFYYGKAFRISSGGTPQELPSDHPIYRRDPEWVQTLYNFGIEFSARIAAYSEDSPFLPSRYVYYREGDLYLMGAPIFNKGEETLVAYEERERERELEARGTKPYIPFIDRGAPLLEDGRPDVEYIRRFGLTVPEKSYFVLGDNHSMSADSRYFGFVPEKNLRGTPLTLLWPWDGRIAGCARTGGRRAPPPPDGPPRSPPPA